MRDEIVAGIKNAMLRGASMERAAQTFINAGYNPTEVKEAINIISSGVSDIIYQEPNNYTENMKSGDNKHSLPEIPKYNGFKERLREKSSGKAILVIVIILSVLIFIGCVSYLIYALLK